MTMKALLFLTAVAVLAIATNAVGAVQGTALADNPEKEIGTIGLSSRANAF